MQNKLRTVRLRRIGCRNEIRFCLDRREGSLYDERER